MSTADELRRVWLFEGLTEDQLNSLSPFTYRKKFGPGELIVEEGHTGNGLYLIASGNVEVIKGLGTEGQQTVNKLGEGEVFGAQDGKRSLSGQRRVLGNRPMGVSRQAREAA